MPLFRREAAIITTAPLASVLARRTTRRRWWLFEFFIAPFTDINHELAARMEAAATRHSLKHTPSKA